MFSWRKANTQLSLIKKSLDRSKWQWQWHDSDSDITLTFWDHMTWKYREIQNFSHFPNSDLAPNSPHRGATRKKETLPPEFSGQWSCSMQPCTTGTVENELANWPMMCSQLRKRMAGCKVEEFHGGMPDYIHFRIAPHGTKSCLELNRISKH